VGRSILISLRLTKICEEPRDEWICFVVEHPEKTVVQSDGRIKKLAHIQDAGKVLRLILLEDGETVHNAFFDRSYKES